MIRVNKKYGFWGTVAAGVVLVVGGLIASKTFLVVLGGVCLAGVATPLGLKWWRGRKPQKPSKTKSRNASIEASTVQIPSRKRPQDESEALAHEMLEQGRFALLLRPQIIENLTPDQFSAALKTLEEQMALVPSGQVVMGLCDESHGDGRLNEEKLQKLNGYVVEVDAVFLDRHLVTNAQFQQFVEAGGYEELAIWDEEVLPALLDFVDTTGYPGPHNWRNGHFESRTADHPVVGISWYEAVAYARWSGKRLPTDAEWTKAGCWPVTLGEGHWLQRKYPWGNSFEDHRANIWSSGWGTTVPVHQFSEGVSVGGVYQLIGNVWEWTNGAYGRSEDSALTLPFPMKSIRGGAFDTYFENQATCQFQSGESPLSRKRNIGFRLAVGACDLSPKATGLAPADVGEQTDEELAIEVTL